VRYLVDDVAAVVSFYTERLGFEVKERWGSIVVIVTREGLDLWLSGPRSSAAEAIRAGESGEPGWNRLVLEIDELEATVAELQRAGVSFRGEEMRGPAGTWVLLDDPFGNPVELFEPRP
jgi:catechol 2,3-dioxygenase-like lactoylglutathione lyase family enzyme